MFRVIVAVVLALTSPTIASANSALSVSGVPEIEDGDTLIFGGRPVNLAYIDAPELGQECHGVFGKRSDRRADKPEHFDAGQTVHRELKTLLGSSQVNCSLIFRYDGVDFAECSAPGIPSINKELIKRGLALVQLPSPFNDVTFRRNVIWLTEKKWRYVKENRTILSNMLHEIESEDQPFGLWGLRPPKNLFVEPMCAYPMYFREQRGWRYRLRLEFTYWQLWTSLSSTFHLYRTRLALGAQINVSWDPKSAGFAKSDIAHGVIARSGSSPYPVSDETHGP